MQRVARVCRWKLSYLLKQWLQSCVSNIVTEPTCSLNTSLPENWVHKSDFLEINCTVEYRGSWTPNVSCVPDAPAQLFVEETTKIRRISYIRVLAAADLGDRANITCETTFFPSDTETSIPTVDEILTDSPRYHHTWHSSPINVTTGSVCRTRAQVSLKNSFWNMISQIRSMDSCSLSWLVQNSK